MKIDTKILRPLKELDERSKKLKLIEYTENVYRLWDDQEQKVVIRRDVILRRRNISSKEDKETSKRQVIELQKTKKTKKNQKRVKKEA